MTTKIRDWNIDKMTQPEIEKIDVLKSIYTAKYSKYCETEVITLSTPENIITEIEFDKIREYLKTFKYKLVSISHKKRQFSFLFTRSF